MRSFDVLIVGAGIVGCACARECAESGLRVGLVEAAVPGGGATAAGMGHVVVMDDSPAQLALTRYSRSLWHQLIPKLSDAVEYETRGTLWVAADQEEMAEVRAKYATYTDAGIRAEILNATEVAAEEPHLRPGVAGGLLVPDDGVIYPPAAADWFLKSALGQGAMMFQSSKVVSASKGEVRLADGTTLHCDRVVLATGADWCAAADNADQETQRATCSLPIAIRTSFITSWWSLDAIQERSQRAGRLGRLQYSTASNGANPDRVFAPVWQRRSKDQNAGILSQMLERGRELYAGAGTDLRACASGLVSAPLLRTSCR